MTRFSNSNQMNRSLDSTNNRFSPKWGLETAVEGRGGDTRVVNVSELRNFRRLTHNRFNFYLSLIDGKHPKFVRTTERGHERWRMRFNVFGAGCWSQWMPSTVLHLGELHVYYELMTDRSKPWCDDFTFYYDYRQIDEEVIEYRYQMMLEALRDSLMGTNQCMKFLLFLPVDRTDFEAANKDLDDFLERQDVMLSQLDQLKRGNRTSATPSKLSHDQQRSRPPLGRPLAKSAQ